MSQAPQACRPVERAEHFLRRYALDTLERIREFSRVRARGREAVVLHETSASSSRWLVRRRRGSPPYPGLIDYHEQHRYAYELLGLDDAASSSSAPRSAESARSDRRLRRGHRDGAREHALGSTTWSPGRERDQRPPRALSGDLRRAGLKVETRYRRHVNRRTVRRAGELFEDVIVARRKAEAECGRSCRCCRCRTWALAADES